MFTVMQSVLYFPVDAVIILLALRMRMKLLFDMVLGPVENWP
jgi:hypothetical protein